MVRVNLSEQLPLLANETATFYIGGERRQPDGRMLICRMNISFLPAAGERYTAQFALGEKRCRVMLEKEPREAGQKAQPVKSLAREYKAPFLESGSFCGAEIIQ
jgi:hypothetical protein